MTEPNTPPSWQGQKSWRAKFTLGRVTVVIVILAILVGVIVTCRSS